MLPPATVVAVAAVAATAATQPPRRKRRRRNRQRHRMPPVNESIVVAFPVNERIMKSQRSPPTQRRSRGSGREKYSGLRPPRGGGLTTDTRPLRGVSHGETITQKHPAVSATLTRKRGVSAPPPASRPTNQLTNQPASQPTSQLTKQNEFQTKRIATNVQLHTTRALGCEGQTYGRPAGWYICY